MIKILWPQRIVNHLLRLHNRLERHTNFYRWRHIFYCLCLVSQLPNLSQKICCKCNFFLLMKWILIQTCLIYLNNFVDGFSSFPFQHCWHACFRWQFVFLITFCSGGTCHSIAPSFRDMWSSLLEAESDPNLERAVHFYLSSYLSKRMFNLQTKFNDFCFWFTNIFCAPFDDFKFMLSFTVNVRPYIMCIYIRCLLCSVYLGPFL